MTKWIDDRTQPANEDVTPTKMYEADREWLRQQYPNSALTWADRLRRLRHQVEASGSKHPYVPQLLELKTRVEEAGYTHEGDLLELLAGLWGRMEDAPQHREALADAGLKGLRDAVSLTLDDEDDGDEDAQGVESWEPEVRANPSAEVEP